MEKQKFEYLKTEYKAFLEYISCVHSLLEELIREGNIFFNEYCKSVYYDTQFVEEFELNLLYLEYFYQNVNDIFEIIDNTSLTKMENPKGNIIKFEKRTDINPSV